MTELKLEVGKTYTNRSGTHVKIGSIVAFSTFPANVPYNMDGRYNTGAASDFDLISEYTPPVQPAAPVGWRLVPVELTDQMISQAWCDTVGKCDHQTLRYMYHNMIANAPEPSLAQPVQPAASGSIEIDFKQVTELLEMFGNEPTVITLMHGDGHSGKGLYAYYTEIPDEGAEYLGEADDEAVPAIKVAQPAPVAPRYPINAAEMREFIGSNFNSLNYGDSNEVPSDNDRYSLSVHDLLSAAREWESYAVVTAPVAKAEPLSDESILNLCSCEVLMPIRQAGDLDDLLIIFARTVIAAQPVQPKEKS